MLSNIERDFALNIIANGQRFDKRDLIHRRPINFTFESEQGCCLVDMGKTKVLAQISWDLVAPKDSRPNNGILKCNVELSMLAHPRFELNSTRHQTSAQLSRLLEKCIGESRCLDLESLCLEAGVKVMCIRVDVHALNDDGNLIGAMCLAAIAALSHFKRPDVSFSGEEVKIHTFAEKDPLSLTLLHIPVCSNFVIIQGNLVLDPTLIEQQICEASIIVACNKFREICLLQVSGETILTPDQVLRCIKLATVEADQISSILHKALDHDVKERLLGNLTSTYPNKMVELIETETIEIDAHDPETSDIIEENQSDGTSEDMDTNIEKVEEFESKLQMIHDDVIFVGLGGESKWKNKDLKINPNKKEQIIENKTENYLQKSNLNIGKSKKKNNKASKKNISSDSEEEVTKILVSDDDTIDKIDLSIALKKMTKKAK